MKRVRGTHVGSRPGGRSEDVRRRVLDAAADELLENGFEHFAMTSVANRAAVHHTTVYRRWPTKSRLVLDAVIERTRARLHPPETGSLRTDLCQYFDSVASALADPSVAALIRALIAMRPDDLATERQAYWGDRLRVVNEMFDDGAARGEVVTAEDRLRVGEMISSPIWMRLLVTGAPVDSAYVEQLVDRALRAINYDDPAASDEAKRLRQLEYENATLKRIVADKELELASLKEPARAHR
jgi:AcrR family transcriptional regulator